MLEINAKRARMSPPTAKPFQYHAMCLRISRHPCSSSACISTRSSQWRSKTRLRSIEVGFGAAELEAVRIGSGPAGVSAGRFSAANQELFRALLDTYIGRVPDELAEMEAAKYAGSRIEALHFAWAGGITKGDPHYYRITGPRLLAEYDNAQNGANHVHSVWRDPMGDFGLDLLGEHLRHHH